MFLRGYLETYTYSLIGCSVNTVWASNTLVVGSTREGSESDGSESKLENHGVEETKAGIGQGRKEEAR